MVAEPPTASCSTSNQGYLLFPFKLHEMLADCERDNLTTVVSWLPSGTAFRVHNVSEFVKSILPSYFNQTKYKSFQRQLNLWGFERITSNGPEKGAYSSEHFVKNQPSLCRYLTRQNSKRSRAKKSLSPPPKAGPPPSQVTKRRSRVENAPAILPAKIDFDIGDFGGDSHDIDFLLDSLAGSTDQVSSGGQQAVNKNAFDFDFLEEYGGPSRIDPSLFSTNPAIQTSWACSV